MKDKEERKLQFVLRYYTYGKLDTRQAWRKMMGEGQSHPSGRRWLYFSGIAAAIFLCIVGYHILWNGKEPHTVCLTAEAGVTRYFLPDSTLLIFSQGATVAYDADTYGKECRAVSLSGKVYFSVRRNVHSPFLATSNYAQVKVLGTEFEVDESRQDTATRVYVKSGKVVFKARYGKDGIILTKDMCGMLTHGDEMPVVSRPAFPNPSAWATGKFVYRNTPIEEVLKELSLYYGTPLYSSAHYRTITGEFKADSLEEIITLIEKTLDIKITKKSR